MKRKFAISVTSFFCAALLCGCSGSGLTGYEGYGFFDAVMRWAYLPQGEDEGVWNALKEYAAQTEASLSLSAETSPIARFNAAAAGETVGLDGVSYSALQTAKAVCERTEGAYNPAIGNLIDLWGFSPRHNSADYAPALPYDRADFKTELPDPDYIEAFLTLADFSQVNLWESGGKYYAQKPSVTAEIGGAEYTMQLNLGGIGKGICADGAAERIAEAGYTAGYFNLGSSSMSVFENPRRKDGLWEIDVKSPRAELGDYLFTAYEKNAALSSSGDSERFYEIGGVRYGHIINPKTGYPVGAAPEEKRDKIIYAAVFGLTAAEGDAVSTALVAMGRDRAVTYVRENLAGVRVYLLWEGKEGCELLTNAADAAYRLRSDLKVTRI